MMKKPIESAIYHVGGVTKLAAAIGIRQSAISNWRARGTIPNAAHCFLIERATNGAVTRRDLRPQDWHLIWPELADSPCTRCRLQAAGAKQSIHLETIQKSEEMP